jgi:hypothetical protein
VVSDDGRPDLAGSALSRVDAPTLLIVGSRDDNIVEMNRLAMAQMGGIVELEIIPNATDGSEVPGPLEGVAARAAAWFRRYLANPGRATSIVPIGEWDTFIDGFNRRHRGWLTSVTATTNTGRSQELSAERPLNSIELVRNAGRISALEIRFQDRMAPRSVVSLAPHILRVDETPCGAERGLHIEDRYGLRTHIRFRATVRPEELDGVAAAEL